MKRLRLLLTCVAIACSLSCSFRGTLAPDVAHGPSGSTALPDPVPTSVGEHRPSAVDWIEARFRSYQTGLSEREIRRVSEALLERAEALELEWPLVLAVIKIESGFHNFARSHVGALGLMQIMPATGEMLAEQLDLPWRGPATLFDPVVNVHMGTAYLRDLHDRFGSWQQALAAYNWGPAAIGRRLRTGRAVPRGYATKVLAQRQSETLR